VSVKVRTRVAACLVVGIAALAGAGLSAQKPKQPPVKPTTAAPAPKAAPKPPPEPPKPQQWKVVSRYVADGVETRTTVYAGARRQRVELPGGMSIVTQCDLSRAIQVSDRAKAYAVVPFVTPSSTPSTPAAAPKPGASVTVKSTGTDTGERKEIFGQQARHLKLVTTTEPTPQACDKKKGRVETDGWFADIPELQECAGAKAMRAPVEAAGSCQDPHVEEHAGINVTGFPLGYSVTSFDAAGKELSKLTVEVTDLTHEALSAPLFEPPPGFAALADADALTDAARRAELEELGTSPKLAGMIRIGVAPAGDRSGKGVATDTIRSGLLEDLNNRPFEAIPLSSTTPEEQQAEARKKECDYLVRPELGTLTTGNSGKVGGLVRRASGGGNPTEIHEAGVAMEVVPIAATTARPKKLTASAKTGAFTWRRAVGLARFAGKIYFGMTGGMMTTLMSSAGGAGGGPLGGGDPTVNAIMMLLGPAASEPSDDLTTPAAVVAAAFHKAAGDLMKELQPK
jgi:hypothetical protein